MAKIKPFRGLRPPKDLVEKVESRPYDVLNSEEARAEAGDNEMRLYHNHEFSYRKARYELLDIFELLSFSLLNRKLHHRSSSSLLKKKE